MTEGVDGRDNVSGNDKEESEEVSIGSFTRLVLARESVWFIRCGSLYDEVGN